MIENWFISIFEISLFISPVILILVITAPFFNKYYKIKWKYPAWAVIAIRLVIPFHIDIPLKELTVNIPLQITTQVTENTRILPVLNTRTSSTGITLSGIISVIWLAAFLLFISINLCSYFYYKKRISREGIYIKDDYTLQQLKILSGELNIKRQIPVIKYPAATSPMVIGFFRPILILPCCQYNKKELFFILKHELVHIKHNDTFFKFLFFTANALHWFNPVVYIMRKEISVDMELCCDETVVSGTSYNNRKEYTKILLSVLQKQNRKKQKTIFSTQFYGGTNIMKKRFKNILTKNKKKKGFYLFACTVIIALVPGIFTSCTVAKPGIASKTPQKDNNTIKEDTLNSRQESSQYKDTTAKQENNIKKDIKTPLSEDGIKVKNVIEEFSNAYFNGNKKGIKKFLTTSYKKDIEIYDFSDKASNITLKGLENIKNGKTCTASLEFKTSPESDTFMYLTIELIKQSNNWKISFYGLEG